jgi:phage gpG-like protein
MIDIEITGTLPKIRVDLTEEMKSIADLLYQGALNQFDSSGGGSWKPTREGNPATLRGVRETLKKDSGKDWAEISFMNTIHQRGGIMFATERQRRYLWATYGEKWGKGSGTRGQGMIMKFPVRAITVSKIILDDIKRELINFTFTIKEDIRK